MHRIILRMQKKFFSNLILILALNLLIKPVAIFGIDVKVQNELGESIFGNYFALLNLAMILNILLDLGVNNFTTRNVAKHPHLIEKYAGKTIPIKLGLFLIYTLIGMSVGIALGWKQMDLFILLLLLFNQFLISCIAYGRSHLGGLLLFRNDSFISIADKFFYILFAGWILYFSPLQSNFSILWLVGIQTGCYLLTLGIVILFLSRRLNTPKLRLDFKFSKILIQKSLPFATLIFLMFMYTRTDALMLKTLLSDGELQAGIYAQGYRVLDALIMFAMLFSNLLYPLFSNLFSQKKSINEILLFSTKLLIGGAISVGIIGYFNSFWIINQLYTSNVEIGANSFRWLSLSFIGFSTIILFGTALTAKGELKKLNTIAFFGVIVNIILNFLLIPIFKAEGAAIATFATQSFIAIAQTIIIIKLLSLQVSRKIIMQFGTTTILLLLIQLFFTRTTGMTAFFASTTISFLVLFFTRMIDFNNLKEVFLKKKS